MRNESGSDVGLNRVPNHKTETMKLSHLNELAVDKATELFFSCCGSDHWVNMMVSARPFRDLPHLCREAEEAWFERCTEKDWLESFSRHPKIGDLEFLKNKFSHSAHLAGKEQSGMMEANDEVIQKIADGNTEYEAKHGFIFIVSATGKSADEMLGILQARLAHSTAEECRIAMAEQHKITLIRLRNHIEENWSLLRSGQLTTHVLDTSLGKPGRLITIRLFDANGKSSCLATGVTNADGRIPDLLPAGRVLAPGHYRMIFESGAYYDRQKVKCFYPVVDICFEIFDSSHYHIPLLISPFGFSTYRGS